MITPQDANLLAEGLITQYLNQTGAASSTEIGKALEMLISTAGRAYEKFVGHRESVQVLSTTAHYILARPARRQQH